MSERRTLTILINVSLSFIWDFRLFANSNNIALKSSFSFGFHSSNFSTTNFAKSLLIASSSSILRVVDKIALTIFLALSSSIPSKIEVEFISL